ncbi:General transcription factor IIH subunit 5 [Porphyridium purpureum]|uniref:General transcription and DNA repair factor IIH subunit TFB5 n=1 Tax=Porphyridium purpureum TaxID=35688 RepID=A0A5J4YTF2_PORPP|nr:General transcription factor IIH subunit 5 [Porphyridium purpureum]|eukprot:POR3868..scf236_6
MVNATYGTLVTCDEPMKQFLRHLDEQHAPNRFIICDLDETHVLVHTWALDLIREELEKLYEENHYVAIS